MRAPYSRRDFLNLLGMGFAASSISPYNSCMHPDNKKNKLGIALVGLGSYSGGQLAPSLLETKHCYLAGIVTGTPAKEKTWGERYSLPQKNIYNYRNFDSISGNSDIDIVYVVLPISMHKEFTIRAAQAGKHVICEKPMALNIKECEEMITACKKANRMLSIGYRLHFEPYTREMMRLGQQKVYGKILEIDCANGFRYGGDSNAWRLK